MINPLELGTEWQEADTEGFSRRATIKIFTNEEEYNEYQQHQDNNEYQNENQID